MFCLDSGKLHEDLCDRTVRLKDMMITFLVEENRMLNSGWEETLPLWFNVYLNLKRANIDHKLNFSRICQKYEEIDTIISSTPETTEQLVSISQYIQKTTDVTIHKLIDEINDAVYRLCFLLDYALLPCMEKVL